MVCALYGIVVTEVYALLYVHCGIKVLQSRGWQRVFCCFFGGRRQNFFFELPAAFLSFLQIFWVFRRRDRDTEWKEGEERRKGEKFALKI